MENQPLRSPQKPAGQGEANDSAVTPSSSADTPLPQEEWSALGSTRVISQQSGAHPLPKIRPKSELPPAAATTSDEELGTIGDFRLLRKLGEGAMGAVYLAHQFSFDREVALKVLFKHVANNPKLVERLYREGRVMGELDHPHIVRGYAIGEAENWHYVAMEYIDGESLQKWLARLGKLPVADAVHITLACARALEYAHRHDIVHRDIKPDNILISHTGQIKVADFGMVKQLDEDMSLTQTGHAVGTPWYMPLEQAKNAKETDGRSDIYALGCMLYCMLTGNPPFSGQTLLEVIQAKEVGTFPPARSANREVPERLDLVIAKMAAKSPRYRYQACSDLLKDLESLKLTSADLSFVERPGDATAKGPSKAAEPAAVPARQADVWYVKYKVPSGNILARKLTTAQVVKLLEDPNFDPTATASRKPSEGFRTLATYKEFEQHTLARAAREGIDQKTVRFRNLYKKIEAQELAREKPEETPTGSAGYWLGIFLRVAGVCAIVGFIAFVLRYFATSLGQ